MRQYLYAAQTECGLVKIGRSADPKRRMADLALKRRVRFERVHVARRSPMHDFPERAEQRAISHALILGARRAFGNEWLRGISFEDACALVDECAATEAGEEPARQARGERWLLRQMRAEQLPRIDEARVLARLPRRVPHLAEEAASP